MVPKSDGTVRICGNFSVTINLHFNLEYYLLSVVNDLSTKAEKCYCLLIWLKHISKSRLGENCKASGSEHSIWLLQVPAASFWFRITSYFKSTITDFGAIGRLVYLQ
jgi:hypothetical protein